MNAYTLEPQDLLFFRDGRPTATAGGHGARWPEPSVIFDALHAALHRAFPKPQSWEHAHRFGRSSDRDLERRATQRFGSLATGGLFPVTTDGRWLFPAPADVQMTMEADGANWLLQPVPLRLRGQCNLPAPFIRYIAGSFAPPTKETSAPWFSSAAVTDYLEGQRPHRGNLFTNNDLFDSEWATGIGIDPETQTQDGKRIYCVEYLRLRPNVRCGFVASLTMKRDGTNDRQETIQNLFTATNTIIVGGQQRPCRVDPLIESAGGLLPPGRTDGFSDGNGRYHVKWTLLSPAIWPEIQADSGKDIHNHPGGWLPNWICAATGKVLLRHRSGVVRRIWDENKKRTARRAESETQIAAQLVGACVPKPFPITGWTERLHLLEAESHWKNSETGKAHGPRCTYLAVPAGAVYYFEADSAKAAELLASALNWHGANPGTEIRNRRSTLMGEKGFGLGVCGSWRPFET